MPFECNQLPLGNHRFLKAILRQVQTNTYTYPKNEVGECDDYDR